MQAARLFLRRVRSYIANLAKVVVLERSRVLELLLIVAFGIAGVVIIVQFLFSPYKSSEPLVEQESVRLSLPVVDQIGEWADDRKDAYDESVNVAGGVFGVPSE